MISKKVFNIIEILLIMYLDNIVADDLKAVYIVIMKEIPGLIKYRGKKHAKRVS